MASCAQACPSTVREEWDAVLPDPPQKQPEPDTEAVYGSATLLQAQEARNKRHGAQQKARRISIGQGTDEAHRQRGQVRSWTCPVQGCGYHCDGVTKASTFCQPLLVTRRKHHVKREHPDRKQEEFQFRTADGPILVPATEKELRRKLRLPAEAPLPPEHAFQQCKDCQRWWPAPTCHDQLRRSILAHRREAHPELVEPRSKLLREARDKKEELSPDEYARWCTAREATIKAASDWKTGRWRVRNATRKACKKAARAEAAADGGPS